jgi:diacylglycerol kinase family enzyme
MADGVAGISVIINERSGGSAEPEAGLQIQSLFAKHGVRVRLERVRDPGDLAARTRQAASRGDTLVAAGGDGTVNAVAGVAVETHTVVGVLPMGTLNHFAKDLGIPLELASAVRVLVERRVTRVDVGEVNGRSFVNNSSIGVYPDIVVQRDELRRQGHRKWTAFALATARALRRYRGVVVRITAGHSTETARTPFLFIGNNEYHVDGMRLGGRDRLDAGRLFAYLAPRLRGRDLPRLLVLALLGRARGHQALESFAAEELHVATRRGRLRVALDGEVALMRTPLHYHVRPRALHVIVP